MFVGETHTTETFQKFSARVCPPHPEHDVRKTLYRHHFKYDVVTTSIQRLSNVMGWLGPTVTCSSQSHKLSTLTPLGYNSIIS